MAPAPSLELAPAVPRFLPQRVTLDLVVGGLTHHLLCCASRASHGAGAGEQSRQLAPKRLVNLRRVELRKWTATRPDVVAVVLALRTNVVAECFVATC